MAKIFKNPNLSDYFVENTAVTMDVPISDIEPITDDYESAKVISLPNLKFDINFDFWANLPTDQYPGVKKLTSLALGPDGGEDVLLERNLARAEVPVALENAIRDEIRRMYDQIVPRYEALFGDYKFKRRMAGWRLNGTYNENLHVDTYLEEYEDHFARMFINLDTQPRIWQTSYTSDEVFEKYGSQIDRKIFETGSKADIWIALNKSAFGGSSKMWWDGQPRHVSYFEPGEVWAVDSRQVSHQIFYGRRAVSVDFFVDTETMKNPRKQYLNIIDDYKARRLAMEEA